MFCYRIFLAVFLTFLAYASGGIAEKKYPALFLHQKSMVYKYVGEVKAEFTETPTPVSHYFIYGNFYVTHYTGNTNLKNAFIVTLQNATTSLKNGNKSSVQTSVPVPTYEALRVLEGPFGIIFTESGQLESVTISEKEPIWSKNIKFAWASLLQLNLEDVDFKLPVKAQSFVVPEYTIHGSCKTSYDVHPKSVSPYDSQTFLVTKFTSPHECSQYKPFNFDYVDIKLCALPEEETMNTASTKVYEIEVNNDNLVLQKLITHGEFNYMLFYHDYKASSAIYSATFTLESIKPSSEYAGPTIDFDSLPSTRDWSYQRTNNHYAIDAALDVTNGRHIAVQKDLISEVENMLIDAANYLAENHIKTTEPDWQRSKVINNIREILTYFEISSFEKIFSIIQNSTILAKKVIRSLFLSIVSQVGTTAANLFAFEIIKTKTVTDLEAVEILVKLPFHVRVPSEDLLTRWDGFIYSFATILSPKVYEALLLAWGTMVYRTFSSVYGHHPRVESCVHYTYQRVLNETTYEKKVFFLGVMHNMQVGPIAKTLSPILSGDIELSERPDYIRLLSIGAMLRSLYFDYDYAIELLWPVMANSSLPLKLRIGSYNILLQQSRTMTDFLRIHWFMMNEQNEHLYNFHITTLKGFAKSHCPCFAKMHEYSSKILELTPAYSPVSKSFTALYVTDTMNNEGDGMQFKLTVVPDEFTEVPEIIYLQQFIMQNHKITSYWALYLQSDGMDNLLQSQNNNFLEFFEGPVTETLIFDFLSKFSTAMTLSRNSFLDMLLFYRDQAIIIKYYDHNSFSNFNNDVKQIYEHYNYLDSYHVIYQNMFEEYAVSDFGVPIVFGASSPTVISLQMHTSNQVAENLSTNISAKVWLFHDYFLRVYNPITDLWHSAEKLSVVNTDVLYQIELDIHNHNILKYINPRYWEIKFIEANVIIQNRGIASINNIKNNEILKIEDSTFSDEVPSAIGTLKSSNSVDFTDNGKQYEVTVFNCENQLSNLTNPEYIKALLPGWENRVSIMFPLSLQIKNCGNIIKIRPSS